MAPAALQAALSLYGVHAGTAEDARVSRLDTGEYVVALGAASDSFLNLFDDDDVAALAKRMLASGSPLTTRVIYKYVLSLADGNSSSTSSIPSIYSDSIPPPPTPRPRPILDGDAQDPRFRRAKLTDLPPALLHRYEQECNGAAAETQVVCFAQKNLALLAIAIQDQHNRADTQAVLRCLSRGLDRPTMLHGLTRDDIDKLPPPTILNVFGDVRGAVDDASTADTRHFSQQQRFDTCRIGSGEWMSLCQAVRDGGRPNDAFVLPVVVHVMQEADADGTDADDQFAPAFVFPFYWRIQRQGFSSQAGDSLVLERGESRIQLNFCWRPEGGGAAHLFLSENVPWVNWDELRRERRPPRHPELGWRLQCPPQSVIKRKRDWYDDAPPPEGKAETTSLNRWKRSARHCDGKEPLITGAKLLDDVQKTISAGGLVALRVTHDISNSRGATLLRSSLGNSFSEGILAMAEQTLDKENPSCIEMAFYEVFSEETQNDPQAPAVACFAFALFHCVYGDNNAGIVLLLEAFAVSEALRGSGIGDRTFHLLCRGLAAQCSTRHTVIAQTLTTAKAKQFWEDRLDATSAARSMMLQLHIQFPELRLLYHGTICLCKERSFHE